MKLTNSNSQVISPTKNNTNFNECIYLQKHVSFSHIDKIFLYPIHRITTQDSFCSTKPPSILKNANYGHHKNYLLLQKLKDVLYLLVMITFFLIFEKVLKLASL